MKVRFETVSPQNILGAKDSQRKIEAKDTQLKDFKPSKQPEHTVHALHIQMPGIKLVSRREANTLWKWAKDPKGPQFHFFLFSALRKSKFNTS